MQNSGWGSGLSADFRISNLKTAISAVFALVAVCASVEAHDIITTPVTWDREISRIFYSRCVSCHREGGTAFSMTAYQETFPWRTAIKEEVLERRMPPWGAVKGYGDFRNDQALTPEQLELLTSWSQGGSPEGDEKDLPEKDKLEEMTKDSAWFAQKPAGTHRKGEIVVSGEFKLTRPFTLDGLFPLSVSADSSLQIIAEFPDGRVEPLLWLDGYKSQFAHPFLFREPVHLTVGTIISGIPPSAKIVLLPLEH